ncbi:MAG TPA: hypothetical protein PLZ95_22415 [Bryobacteraceae bacterium]|nr:hypothetical protein [Bryobacteraceae bacterium]
MKPNYTHAHVIGQSPMLEWPILATTGNDLSHQCDSDVMSESVELRLGHIVVAAVLILASVIVNALPG